MSTKIFNGYRLPRDAPLAFVAELRSALEPVYREAYLALSASVAAWAVDGLIRGDLSQPSDDPLGKLQAMLMEQRSPSVFAMLVLEEFHDQIRKTGRRQPRFDLEFELTLLPDPDDPSLVYAMIFTERDDYRSAFEGLSGVEPWPYWNSSDRPDEVTEAEWDVRRDTWGRVLGADPPALRGLGWTLVGTRHRHLASRADLAARLPSRHERARMIAERSVTGWAIEDGFSALTALVRQRAGEIEPSLREITEENLLLVPRMAS
jgi:hypothetical protein